MSIFVSYSHQNKVFVDKLCRNLISTKIHLWVDRWELKPGDSLIDSIQVALQHVGAILVVLSKSYVDSTWCKKEMNSGLIRELEEKGNIIIPIVIEDCNIPIFLREKMYADFRGSFDDAYHTLVESLSKYINLDQGRFDIPDFHVDYSSEYFSLKNQILGLRYQFVEHAENRPYSILSIVHIFFNSKWRKIHFKFLTQENEIIARKALNLILIKFFEKKKIKIELNDANPIRKKIHIYNTRKRLFALIDFEIRWMGEDTGKTIIYWAGHSIKNALNDFMKKVTPLSSSELEKLRMLKRK